MEDGFSPERRACLVRLAAGLAVAPALLSLPACRQEPPRPSEPPLAPVRVPLASLPLGERVLVHMGRRPVEVVRDAQGVRARSLWCTHMGCAVAWKPEEDRYRCRCHDGLFDADGQPIAGPPTRPLRMLPVTLEGDVAVIGTGIAAS